MYQYKVGDKVKLRPNCIEYVGHAFELFTLQKNSEGRLCVFTDTGVSLCAQEYDWQLVEPKEKTIDDVEVGDEIICGSYCYEVLEVLEKLIAVRTEVGKIEWAIKDLLSSGGWKIKQPEPDPRCDINSAEKEKWLEKGEKEGWLKEGRIAV